STASNGAAPCLICCGFGSPRPTSSTIHDHLASLPGLVWSRRSSAASPGPSQGLRDGTDIVDGFIRMTNRHGALHPSNRSSRRPSIAPGPARVDGTVLHTERFSWGPAGDPPHVQDPRTGRAPEGQVDQGDFEPLTFWLPASLG